MQVVTYKGYDVLHQMIWTERLLNTAKKYHHLGSMILWQEGTAQLVMDILNKFTPEVVLRSLAAPENDKVMCMSTRHALMIVIACHIVVAGSHRDIRYTQCSKQSASYITYLLTSVWSDWKARHGRISKMKSTWHREMIGYRIILAQLLASGQHVLQQ